MKEMGKIDPCEKNIEKKENKIGKYKEERG